MESDEKLRDSFSNEMEAAKVLQAAINKGLSELATLKDDESGATVREDSQVTKLAKMLGVKPEGVKGKTFKDIGEMAQATLKLIILTAIGNYQLKSSDGLDGLKSLKGPTIVSSLMLGDNANQLLAEMLGRSVEEIQDKSFTEIGEMAATINIQYASLKSVEKSVGTHRTRWGIEKLAARFSIAMEKRKDVGLFKAVIEMCDEDFSFTQILHHCSIFSKENKEGINHMVDLLIKNKSSLQEQCLMMNESDFNTHYQNVYNQMGLFGDNRDKLIRELFMDIKIDGGKSPDFKKLYRGKLLLKQIHRLHVKISKYETL